MKQLFFCVILMVPLLCLADTVVPVASVESFVNVRRAPEAGAEVVARLQQGSSLPFVAAADGWNEVRLADGESGFISADWTMVVTAPLATPAPAVAEVAAEVAAEIVEEVEEVEEVGEVEDAVAIGATEVTQPDVATQPEPEPERQPVAETPAGTAGATGPTGPAGPPGPMGPPGADGAGSIKGDPGYLVKFKDENAGTTSQLFDDGNQVGIGTAEPKQRLEVNGSIQIHDRNSGVAGLMITQSSGETGYIMHNRASTLTIGAGSVDRVTITGDGNVGLGAARPAHPLQMASGAHVTAGGAWTNSSSRALKENIRSLQPEEALATLQALQPVQFNYISDRAEAHVGFIAEDVPELVASSDRQGLSTMDIVAVLTRVIQAQQQQIDALQERIDSTD